MDWGRAKEAVDQVWCVVRGRGSALGLQGAAPGSDPGDHGAAARRACRNRWRIMLDTCACI